MADDKVIKFPVDQDRFTAVLLELLDDLRDHPDRVQEAVIIWRYKEDGERAVLKNGWIGVTSSIMVLGLVDYMKDLIRMFIHENG